jgi:hypothetical protein
MSLARIARSIGRWAPALAIAAAVLLGWSAPAQAQATSWLYVGGGAGIVDADERESHPLLQVDTGLGTSARHALVIGGIFRAQGYFGAGLDLGGAARLVTRGFALGGFGGGIDAGVYQRLWGDTGPGFAGNLILGAPWGLTLLGGASLGPGESRIYHVSLGIDLARLTVHRHTGLDWFENPMRSPAD